MNDVPEPYYGSEKLRHALRVVCAAVGGPVAGILSELVGAVLPDPKIAKLEDLLALAAAQIGKLRIDVREIQDRLRESEIARTTLVEAFEAAHSTTSTDQRAGLARLLVSGLRVQPSAQLDVLMLLRQFAQLDEHEVLYLTALAVTDEARNRLANAHPDVFSWAVLSAPSTTDELDVRAMHDMRVRHLMALGLVKRKPPFSMIDGEHVTWERTRITRPGLALVRLTHSDPTEVLGEHLEA